MIEVKLRNKNNPQAEPVYVDRLELEQAIITAYAPGELAQEIENNEKNSSKEFLQRQKDLRAEEAGDAIED